MKAPAREVGLPTPTLPEGNPAYRAQRAADAAGLAAALSAYPAEATPCRAGEVPPPAWTSDSPADQTLAAAACAACPLRTACALYGLTHRRESGVYGGWTDAARRAAARPPHYYRSSREALWSSLGVPTT